MSAARIATLAVVVLALCVLRAGDALAQGSSFFNTSPGALSASHASIDGPDHCNDCHDGGRETINDRCLGCHDHSDLRGRIASGKGFHSSSLVKGKKCESCHLEHKGRNYDLMGWRTVAGCEKGFDHKLTGWPLEGKHTAIDCADCHKTKNKQGLRTYMGTDRSCGSCHKDDQPHGFERSDMMACERCHGQGVWKPAKSNMDFDHDRKSDALMPLIGSHEDVSCAKCHPKALFNLKAPKPDSCGNSGCHQSPHEGHLFGKKECETCHSPTFGTLARIRFDHDRRTKFDLGLAHGKLQCYGCHTKKVGEAKPSMECERCHATDNKHGNRFDAFGSPPKCDTCHSTAVKKWTGNAFEHDKKTKFTLTGRHDEIDCRGCHRGKNPAEFERFDPKTVGCMGCHSHTNVHNKEHPDSKCLTCHLQPGEINLKAKSVDVYHGPRSDFPLVKAHKVVKCAQCHLNDTFKNTPKECGDRCHKDSLHQGTLGKECSRCHTGGEWNATVFDHAKDTEFPLKGLHQRVECAGCHPVRKYDGTPKECSAGPCHQKDDAHQGKLGNACERCHIETGENKFNHNTMARFQLDGQHLGVRCASCHASVSFKPQPTNCFGCHPEPAVHKGQYGTVCETCHTTKSFKDIKALHDVGDFSLKGAHDNQPCAKCHKDSRPLAGAGNLCINCHRQDDIHSNSLSPRCGECHTQWSFAPARFDHTQVGCNLTGLHRTLSCNDCHKSGNYGGLNPSCAGCHRDDAGRQATPYHAATPTCANCHNPNAWLPAAVNGSTAYGRESVCR